MNDGISIHMTITFWRKKDPKEAEYLVTETFVFDTYTKASQEIERIMETYDFCTQDICSISMKTVIDRKE